MCAGTVLLWPLAYEHFTAQNKITSPLVISSELYLESTDIVYLSSCGNESVYNLSI